MKKPNDKDIVCVRKMYIYANLARLPFYLIDNTKSYYYLFQENEKSIIISEKQKIGFKPLNYVCGKSGKYFSICISKTAIPDCYYTFYKIKDGWYLKPSNSNEAKNMKPHQSVINTGNVICNNFFRLTKEQTEKLDTKNNFLKVCLFNDDKDGSYIIAKPYPKNGIKKRTTIHLPIAFIRKTNIKQGDTLNSWINENGELVIEGKPGICSTCGKIISRYKTPIHRAKGCEACSNELSTVKDLLFEIDVKEALSRYSNSIADIILTMNKIGEH